MKNKPTALYIPGLVRPDLGIINKIRNRLNRQYNYQDGFFRASLHAAFDVKEHSLQTLYKHPDLAKNFDAVFINWKCLQTGQAASHEDLSFLKKIDRPKIMAATNAVPGQLPDDTTMDLFDIIFKREMFRDRGQYKISFSNKEKLHTTMLSCPTVHAYLGQDMSKFDATKFGYKTPPSDFECDVFFAGGCTSNHRYDIAKALYEARNLKTDITLYSRPQMSVAGSPFEGKRLSLKKYKDKTRSAKINLALDGIGPFTYRHLELWCLNSFFISTPAIENLDLPIPAKNGTHYISYNSTDDLIELCQHYNNNEKERLKIAQAGRNLFEEYYNFNKHGEFIKDTVFKTQSAP